jgi:hypothetical protein
MTTNITAYPMDTGSDEIERYALEDCVKRQRVDHRVSVLILPDKRCELASKFARLGAQVVIADIAAHRSQVEGRILASGQQDQMSFVPGDLNKLPEHPRGEPFDLIVIRRGLCHLPYEEAKNTIRQLMHKLKIGGKLYVSILGLHSELGEGYPAGETPVGQRFAKLSPAFAGKYGIHDPVCLYTERNLFMLLHEAGASVLRTLTTTHGNVKGVAVRV